MLLIYIFIKWLLNFGCKKEQTNFYCSFAQNSYFVDCESSSSASIRKGRLASIKTSLKRNAKYAKNPDRIGVFREAFILLPLYGAGNRT